MGHLTSLGASHVPSVLACRTSSWSAPLWLARPPPPSGRSCVGIDHAVACTGGLLSSAASRRAADFAPGHRGCTAAIPVISDLLSLVPPGFLTIGAGLVPLLAAAPPPPQPHLAIWGTPDKHIAPSAPSPPHPHAAASHPQVPPRSLHTLPALPPPPPPLASDTYPWLLPALGGGRRLPSLPRFCLLPRRQMQVYHCAAAMRCLTEHHHP